jgi:hypothetical protein
MRSLVVAIFLAVFPYAAEAQTHQHGAMSDGDGQFNPYVASDDRGGFYLAYVQRQGGQSNVYLRRSSDGRTFSDPVRVNDRDGDAAVRNENPPKVLAGPNNQVYVCWANEREKWKGNIRFARSTDGGKAFTSAITINSDGNAKPAGHAFQSIAVDVQGRIYVAWIDERNKKSSDRGAEIWLAESSDDGRSFSRDRRVLGDVCECCRTSLQTNPNGVIYLTYRTVPRNGPMYRDIVLARSRDGGRNFEQTVVSHDNWEVNGCPVAGPGFSVDGSGHVTVIWFIGGEKPGLYYATSMDAGVSFSPRQPLDAQRHDGRHAQSVQLANGRILTAWDYGIDKVSVAWGFLDPQKEKGLLERSSGYEGISYPTVATSGRRVVVAGMRSATREIVTYVEAVGSSSGIKGND